MNWRTLPRLDGEVPRHEPPAIRQRETLAMAIDQLLVGFEDDVAISALTAVLARQVILAGDDPQDVIELFMALADLDDAPLIAPLM